MVDVVLVKPPLSAEDVWGDMSDIGAYEAPLGPAYLAASLVNNNITVEIIDGYIAKLPLQQLVSRILEKNPRYVGISAVTLEIYSAAKLALLVKEKNPNIVTILGGVHLTADPAATMTEFSQFDAGVVGEGEATLVELILALNAHRNIAGIPGLVYRDNGKVRLSEPRELNRELDSLPSPAWNLIPGFPEKYSPPAYASNATSSCSILTSRGCGHKCTFCFQGTMGRLLRFHTAAYVLKTVKHLYHDYGIRDFRILDDQFLADKKRTREICDLLIKENLNITFSCLARINSIDTEILQLLKRAGCRQISFGIESGSQRMLDFIKKGIRLDDVSRAVTLTHAAGILTLGYFIMGFPTETEETLQETMNFACSLMLDDISIFFLTPFPGTEIYRTAEGYGALDKNWGKMSLCTDPSFIPNGLTKEKLMSYRKKTFRKFYFRPRIIWSYLKRIESLDQIKVLFGGVLAMIKLTFTQKKVR
jgi:anaerobic magnesium-protoporphyrin IX monomethyl ester cyclase